MPARSALGPPMVRSGRLPAHEMLAPGFLGYVLDDPCSYCGARQGEVLDHIVPVADGGPDDWTNRTSACVSCNAAKGRRSLLMHLLGRRAR